MSSIAELRDRLKGRLIVSCQAAPGDPFCEPKLIAKFAEAAALGGAAAIRAEGAENIRAIRQTLTVPIIGIRKCIQADGAVLITPSFESAVKLVDAGASMIALDCSARGQRYGAFERMRRIRLELGVPVLADIATVEEAVAASRAGADFVVSTLRGYTAETAHIKEFDAQFIRQLVEHVPIPVIAEGRIHYPEQARSAIANGAFAVVVGTAISRPRDITQAFARVIQSEVERLLYDHFAIGIDLGATNTKFGLVSQKGELKFSDCTPTPAGAGREGLLAHLKTIAFQTLARSQQLGFTPIGIGVATAGWVDHTRGLVTYATENLPGWTGTHIADELAAATDMNVVVENDANALAVAEKEFGAGKAFADFVCLTLGTGVGGGCYIGGRLNRGAHFCANAIGHIIVEPNGLPCSCGKRGCLEAYTNTAALLRYADHRFHDCREIVEAANHGSAAAIAAIQMLGKRLAQGCASIIQLLDPDAIILSGGLAQQNPLLISCLRKCLEDLVSNWNTRSVQIVSSPLGYYGGVLGAAALVFQANAQARADHW